MSDQQPTADPAGTGVGDQVRLDIAGRVATITLNRPEVRNAMNRDTWSVLLRHLADVRSSGARVLVLTGAGGSFCAGADTSATTMTQLHPLDRLEHVTESFVALQELPLPVIAKVGGPAAGAGWSLALCSDFVVASSEATFTTAFAKRGLSLDTGASWLLPRTSR